MTGLRHLHPVWDAPSLSMSCSSGRRSRKRHQSVQRCQRGAQRGRSEVAAFAATFGVYRSHIDCRSVSDYHIGHICRILTLTFLISFFIFHRFFSLTRLRRQDMAPRSRARLDQIYASQTFYHCQLSLLSFAHRLFKLNFKSISFGVWAVWGWRIWLR